MLHRLGGRKRGDFKRIIHHGTVAAAIEWEAAIRALDTGGLPSSGGEKRMLRLAAILGLLVEAVLYASGQRQRLI